MKTNGGRSPEQILAEVESVRHEMDSTLSAIERKLTPGQLLDQSLEYLRSSGANQFVSNLGTSVKQNPLPVTLVGIGLAWLMAANRNHGAGASMASSAGRRLGDAAAGAASDARERMGQTRQTLVDAAQSARERFDEARQSISDTAESARSKWNQARRSIAETAYTARETVRRGADSAKLQLERARSGYDWILREQPLALGAVGLAVGALLAASAPRTRTEDELMGETSDRLAERAKEAGREQLETVKQAIEPVTEKVKEVVEPLVSEKQEASAASS